MLRRDAQPRSRKERKMCVFFRKCVKSVRGDLVLGLPVESWYRLIRITFLLRKRIHGAQSLTFDIMKRLAMSPTDWRDCDAGRRLRCSIARLNNEAPPKVFASVDRTIPYARAPKLPSQSLLWLIVIALSVVGCESDSSTVDPVGHTPKQNRAGNASRPSSRIPSLAEIAAHPRLVILYATCSVNNSYLSPYNAAVTYTPHLDAFAKKSLVFNSHHTESGQSGISYASLFSGTQADRHGVYFHPMRLDDELYLITEAFAENGYDTFFWNKHGMASRRLNFAQGVQPNQVFKHILKADDEQFVKILDRIDSDPQYRAMVVVNFTVTHRLYSLKKRDVGMASFVKEYPSESEGLTDDQYDVYSQFYWENGNALSFDLKETLARHNLNAADLSRLCSVVDLIYKKCVNDLDRLFGELVDELQRRELLEDSMIVFTADHGEILYRENAAMQWTHGFQLAAEVLNVPLIVYAPKSGVAPGRYGDVSRSIDVFPTMLGLCGIALSEERGIAGVNLSGVLRQGRTLTDLPAYSHTSLLGPAAGRVVRGSPLAKLHSDGDPERIWVAVRHGDTYHRKIPLDENNWSYEVYDLAVDPIQQHNIYDPQDAMHVRVQQELDAYQQRLVDGFRQMEIGPDGHARQPSPSETLRRLKSLGYVQ